MSTRSNILFDKAIQELDRVHWTDRRNACRSSYQAFLRSSYWRKVAWAVKCRARHRCELCASPQNLNVHHKTYNNHGAEHFHLDDLICLCEKCHSRFHDKTAGPGKPLDLQPLDEAMPKSPEKRRAWVNRNLRPNLMPRAMQFFEKLEKDTGISVRHFPALRTQLSLHLGVTIKLAGRVVWELGLEGRIQNYTGGPFTLTDGLR